MYKVKSTAFYGALFDAFDTDLNGELSFVEFLMAISTTSQKDQEKKLKIVFKVYDINKDGKIEKKEIIKILKSIVKLNEKLDMISDSEIEAVAIEFFSKLDTNKDNYISEQEFIEGCMKNQTIMESLNSFA